MTRITIGRYDNGPTHGWGNHGYFLRDKDGDHYYPDGPMGGYDSEMLKRIKASDDVEFLKTGFIQKHEGRTVTVKPTKQDKTMLMLARTLDDKL